MSKLSKRVVEAFPVEARDRDYYDDEIKGYGIRVRSSGRRTYFVMTRLNGVMRRFTIGAHGPVTAEMARAKAKLLLADVINGKDPTLSKNRAKVGDKISDLCERFLAEYVPAHCKASTAFEYQRSVELFVLPKLGKSPIAEIERKDIMALHHDMRNIPYQANRTVGVLSVMFAQAERWGLRTEASNPCLGVKRYKEEKRERFLSPDELQRLGNVMKDAEVEMPSAVACFRLLILTGCRLSEIQTLRWEYVRDRMIYLPDSKTGKKTIYLGLPALQVLETVPRVPGNAYVITGRVEGQYLTDLQKPWRRIRAAAGLDDVRIHDLRHTFASNGVALGQGLPIIGKLLGHSQAQTTARYAHLAADPALAAADQISTQIAAAMK